MTNSTPEKLMQAASAAVLCLFLGACSALVDGAGQRAPKRDRGITINHELHVSEGMACADCHTMESPASYFPDHEMCSICHDIDVDNPEPQACMLCHTREDLEIDAWESRLSEELKFTHDAHTAASLECTACHGENVSQPLPATVFKPWCMDCHQSSGPELNACAVCHQTVSKDVRPAFNGKRRIAHDSPEVWLKIHGREAGASQKFCAMCHDDQNFCTECHAVTPPSDHTIHWKRAAHGLEASWNRQSCSVCHEEDSCLQCHLNTEPRSHRHAGFAGSRNTHCVECHFPENESGCTVCHENIEHRFALPSPHALGIYPEDCSRCHPGGLPNQAPHLMNSSTQCAVCHQ